MCTCDHGWGGHDCATSSCPNACSRRGYCLGGVCSCPACFSGADCAIREKGTPQCGGPALPPSPNGSNASSNLSNISIHRAAALVAAAEPAPRAAAEAPPPPPRPPPPEFEALSRLVLRVAPKAYDLHMAAARAGRELETLRQVLGEARRAVGVPPQLIAEAEARLEVVAHHALRYRSSAHREGAPPLLSLVALRGGNASLPHAEGMMAHEAAREARPGLQTLALVASPAPRRETHADAPHPAEARGPAAPLANASRLPEASSGGGRSGRSGGNSSRLERGEAAAAPVAAPIAEGVGSAAGASLLAAGVAVAACGAYNVRRQLRKG